MSKQILPYPRLGTGTDTPNVPIPTPAQIETALTVVGAEQLAPGVWTATLSIGLTIRIADPAIVDGCPDCTCDPLTCRTDATGQHCEIMSCGACLHGCPTDEHDTRSGVSDAH